MLGILEIITPATSRAILSADELRIAGGLSSIDTSQDGRLSELGLRAADFISSKCGVAGDGINIPTLFSEVCRDTFRPSLPSPNLLLSRRFVSAVTSVVENDVTLTSAEYEIDRASGVLRRILENKPSRWAEAKIVVTYTAGLVTIPTDLKHAAELVVRQMVAQSSRDPMIRSERVDGVGEIDYWVGAGDSSDPVAMAVTNLLRPYTSWGS